MGNKSGKRDDLGLSSASLASLNANELRRLTTFLESRGSHATFSLQDVQKMWHEHLVPDLLQSYCNFVMRQGSSSKKHITLSEFITIYSSLVRGEETEKASCLANIIGPPVKNKDGVQVVFYNALVKYLADLLESFYLNLKTQNDSCYKSWTSVKQPERSIMEQVMHGITADIPRKNDEVKVDDMELWLQTCGLVTDLHIFVLGSLYNLEPEQGSHIIPQAVLPTTRTPIILDLSHTVYLCSFLHQELKSKWRFLFSTTTHGESFSKLVGCISNQGPIIFVLEAEDKSVFGGFIAESISPGPRWVGTECCFLFKLKPTIHVFPTTGYNHHFAYLNMQQTTLPNGLGMGGQYDYWGLWIDSHFGIGQCSESCTTYKNYSKLCSQKKFKILKLEAWAVGYPPPTDEEKGERSNFGAATIMERDPIAASMLEMSGRKMHSKGFKETENKTE